MESNKKKLKHLIEGLLMRESEHIIYKESFKKKKSRWRVAMFGVVSRKK
jgi:hypothetical protein